jgi:molybdenum cofactor cytidylyltransferase
MGIVRGDIVALVGAGGKTTTLISLAQALVGRNWRVVATVTTHLGREQSALFPHHLIWEGPGNHTTMLEQAFESAQIVLVTGPPIEGGRRWDGILPEQVAAVANVQGVDTVLVEADGARGRAFKAPAPHEPVIPACTTLLVPTAAVDGVGQPLAEVAHRPKQVAQLTGLGLDDQVTAAAVATTLAHAEGGLKGRPPLARVRALVNKMDSPDALTIGREIAEGILSTSGAAEVIEGVVLGAVGTRQPVREVRRRVASVILAAGRSLRMEGQVPKLLLPWNDTPVIRQVVATVGNCRGLARHTHVVVGAHADEISEALTGSGTRIVFNPDYAAGEMLSSLQAGVRSLPEGISACLVLLGDQPWLACEVIEATLAGYAGSPVRLVAPVYQGRRGHPVLIDRCYWTELLALPHGSAPRALLERHRKDTLMVPVETDAILGDMDTQEAYSRALIKWGPGEPTN